MKAPISEIFSSIQGEGILIGRRQIFVRFSGCNLDCIYCDTLDSKDKDHGNLLSPANVVNKINELVTPDLHSISFTGGEPTLYPEFINEVIHRVNLKTKIKTLLETNGSIYKQINLLNNIDYASIDIKLPEHFNEWNLDIFESELKSVEILVEKRVKVYCKIVVLPSTKINDVEEVVIKLSKRVSNNNVPLIIQPSSPINHWKGKEKKILKFSEICGKYMDVLTIPQVHKCLGVD
ncbi:MAG: 7-carboxy-7-deazaguanine synthase QueE [Methanobrevibacter sp.]|jgi:organic radical activating enzyme|nr:7-carboxy-7-deazaguanine synthase QueE [Candidatus Methanovirga meridionalis]